MLKESSTESLFSHSKNGGFWLAERRNESTNCSSFTICPQPFGQCPNENVFFSSSCEVFPKLSIYWHLNFCTTLYAMPRQELVKGFDPIFSHKMYFLNIFLRPPWPAFGSLFWAIDCHPERTSEMGLASSCWESIGAALSQSSLAVRFTISEVRIQLGLRAV